MTTERAPAAGVRKRPCTLAEAPPTLRALLEERDNIITTFARCLKISPMHLQFKSVTRKADSNKHVQALRQDLAEEENGLCRDQGERYIEFVQNVGDREALSRRFFLIFSYEPIGYALPPYRPKLDCKTQRNVFTSGAASS